MTSQLEEVCSRSPARPNIHHNPSISATLLISGASATPMQQRCSPSIHISAYTRVQELQKQSYNAESNLSTHWFTVVVQLKCCSAEVVIIQTWESLNLWNPPVTFTLAKNMLVIKQLMYEVLIFRASFFGLRWYTEVYVGNNFQCHNWEWTPAA